MIFLFGNFNNMLIVLINKNNKKITFDSLDNLYKCIYRFLRVRVRNNYELINA